MAEEIQRRLNEVASTCGDGARRAREWVRAVRASFPSVDNDAGLLIEKSYRLENLSRKIAAAAERRMCIGIYGASQQGKSYLVSVLARPKDGPLLTRFGGRTINFISDINPSGGKESTGLVTRFTLHPSGHPADEAHPVELRLLTETDLVKILGNAFQSDFDQNNLKIVRPVGESVIAALAAAEKAKAPKPVAPHVHELALFDVGEYFRDNFSTRWRELEPIGYWKRLLEIGPFLELDARAALFSVLWGGIPQLTELFRRLAGWLGKLGNAEDALTSLDALVPRERSIIDVAALRRLADGDDSDDMLPVRPIRGCDAGTPVQVPRAVLASLVAELRLTIDQRPYEMLDHADVLDFPGARSREKFTDLADLGGPEGERRDLDLLLRGKIAYLFQRFSDERELTALLLCMGNKPNEVKDLGALVKHWIDLTHGHDAASRAKVRTALFLVLTMIDLEFQQKDGDKSGKSLWDNRLKSSLIEAFKVERWAEDWDGKPFRNTLMLRNPNFNQEHLVEYETEANGQLRSPLKEVGLSVRNRGYIEALDQSFHGSDLVQRHVDDHAVVWKAMLELNDGGVGHIVRRLSGVLDPGLKVTQLGQRLGDGSRDLNASLRVFYHGVDDASLAEKQAALKAIRQAIIDAFGKNIRAFPGFIGHLLLSERDIRDVARNVGARAVDAAPEERPLSLDDLFGPDGGEAGVAAPIVDRAHVFAHELFSYWSSQLGRLGSDDAFLRIYGLKGRDVSAIVKEIVTLADRKGVKNLLAERVRAATQLAAGQWDEMTERVVTIALHSFNAVVAELGFGDLPLADRPGWPENDPNPQMRVFQPPPFIERPDPATPRQLPDLGAAPADTARAYFRDWVVAFVAAGMANLSHGGGRELDEKQNAALGEILKLLAADASASAA